MNSPLLKEELEERKERKEGKEEGDRNGGR